MRILVVLILAAAFVGGWFIWSRDPLADVPTSAHGFIDVPLPHGTDANTVLILTPPHSPDDLRQTADALQKALQEAIQRRHLPTDPIGERPSRRPIKTTFSW